MFSLIAGLLFCIPPSPFFALILGFTALRSTEPQIGGRAAARAGILLSVLGFTILGSFFYTTFWMSRPASNFTIHFIDDLAAGRVESVRLQCDGDVTNLEIAQWEEMIHSLPQPVHVESSMPLHSLKQKGGATRFAYSLDAFVTAADGKPRTYQVDLIRSDGQFHVLNLKELPNQPAK